MNFQYSLFYYLCYSLYFMKKGWGYLSSTQLVTTSYFEHIVASLDIINLLLYYYILHFIFVAGLLIGYFVWKIEIPWKKNTCISKTQPRRWYLHSLFSHLGQLLWFLCVWVFSINKKRADLIKQIFFILLFHLFEAFCLSLYLDKHHRNINIVPYKY